MAQDSRKTRKERRAKIKRSEGNGVAAAVPPTEGPRWKMTVTPNGREAHIEVMVSAEDVTGAEIAFFTSKVVTEFISRAGSRLPTEHEMRAQQRASQVAKDAPAVRVFARDGRQLWLGTAAVEGHRNDLKAAGWVDAGAPPEGVVRACDYALDPEGVKILWEQTEA